MQRGNRYFLSLLKNAPVYEQNARAWSQCSSQFSTQASSAGDIKWVFLGPPGVGKGTYASRVSKHLGIAHIATGDMIRDEIQRGSSFGRQVCHFSSRLATSGSCRHVCMEGCMAYSLP